MDECERLSQGYASSIFNRTCLRSAKTATHLLLPVASLHVKQRILPAVHSAIKATYYVTPNRMAEWCLLPICCDCALHRQKCVPLRQISAPVENLCACLYSDSRTRLI